MNNLNPDYIFFDLIKTFKVFDDLDLAIANHRLTGTSETIWEIINHLITWQQSRIAVLTGQLSLQDIDDKETPVDNIADPGLLNSAAGTFKNQLNEIKTIISDLEQNTTAHIQGELKQISDIRSHLSHHLKEVITIRRQLKNYPMPDEMIAFLCDE